MQFDWTTISDAVLTIRYTAQQVGKSKSVRDDTKEGWIEPFVLSLRDNFAAEFQTLVNANAADPLKVLIALPRYSLPAAGSAGIWKLCAIVEDVETPVFIVGGDEVGGRTMYPYPRKDASTRLCVWNVQSEKMKELGGKGVEIQRNDSKARLKDVVLIRV